MTLDAFLRAVRSKPLDAALWIAGALLVVVVAWNAFRVFGPAGRSPANASEEAGCDLGTVAANDSFERSFHLANRGGVPLTIEKVLVSCGCVTLLDEFQQVTVEPGGSRELRFQWIVKEAPESAGAATMMNQIFVLSDDPRTPVLTLTVQGTAGSRETSLDRSATQAVVNVSSGPSS